MPSRRRQIAKKKGRIAPAVFFSTDAAAGHFMLDATKSQFTKFQNASTYFGRALR